MQPEQLTASSSLLGEDNRVDTNYRHGVGLMAMRACEGAIVGAVLVSGYAAADAVEHTTVHEKIGNLETTAHLVPGRASSFSVFDNRVYIDRNRSVAGQNLGVAIEIKKLPEISTLPALAASVASLSRNLGKAGEGTELALKEAYLQQAKHELLLTDGVGGLLFALGFAGGGVLLDDRRRHRRIIANQQQRITALLRGKAESVEQSDDELHPAEQPAASHEGALPLSEIKNHTQRRKRIVTKAAILLTTATLSAGVGLMKLASEEQSGPDASSRIDIPSLAPLGVKGAYTDSVTTRDNINNLARVYQRITVDLRQQRKEYVTSATDSLYTERAAIATPKQGETMFVATSDIHSNLAMLTMIRKTVELINEQSPDNPVAFVITAGDDTYGTSIEKGSVDSEATIADGAPVAAVDGNHNSPLTDEQFADAGIVRLDGKRSVVAGVPIVAVGDPMMTVLFGGTSPRRNQTEAEAGQALYEMAKKSGDMPIGDIHEGYAAGEVLGIKDVIITKMTQWFNERGSTVVPWEDGVRDLPFSLLIYGHWHRIIEPRTVYNSDGTWTEVMELNTGGGAIAGATFNHFSTPLGKPGQTASFPVIFRNTASGLITGYQMYTFDTTGQVTVSPRINIGSPDGQPYPVASGQSKTGIGNGTSGAKKYTSEAH